MMARAALMQIQEVGDGSNLVVTLTGMSKINDLSPKQMFIL